jgi:hypothetical protein
MVIGKGRGGRSRFVLKFLGFYFIMVCVAKEGCCVGLSIVLLCWIVSIKV